MTIQAEERLKPYVPETPTDVETLRDRLEAYRVTLGEMKRNNQVVDASVANGIIDGFFALLNDIEHPMLFKTVEGGIAYLIADEDDSYDQEVGGFDDDAEVFNYVCDICGRGDLKIPI